MQMGRKTEVTYFYMSGCWSQMESKWSFKVSIFTTFLAADQQQDLFAPFLSCPGIRDAALKTKKGAINKTQSELMKSKTESGLRCTMHLEQENSNKLRYKFISDITIFREHKGDGRDIYFRTTREYWLEEFDVLFQKGQQSQGQVPYREHETIFEVGELFVAFLTAVHAILLVHHLLVAVFTGTGLI